MVREIAVAAAVTYAVVSIPVAAQVGETGNQFYARCQAEAGKADGQCDTYIQGVADTLAAFGKGGNANGICGRGYNRGQLSRIYLDMGPEKPDHRQPSSPSRRDVRIARGISMSGQLMIEE